VDSKAEWSA